jgi:S-adenosylmethionine:tRNA ribosyltransferase-isomerase
MSIDTFDYRLPDERIAQEPPLRREDARMMVLRRGEGRLSDRRVRDLPSYLGPEDLVVVNDTRVRRARLFGSKESGGAVEVLLLTRREQGSAELWSALVRSSRPLRRGTELRLEGGMVARVEEAGDDGVVLGLTPPEGRSLEAHLERWGHVPLPPYIRRGSDDGRAELDRERYQTVYARHLGSAAAPTAGLHFTPGLLEQLAERGIRVAKVTLHVGRGTFEPIRAGRIQDHRMHAEWCRLPGSTARAIDDARARGGRVVAVGTTVVRTLEARWGDRGPEPGDGTVDLFLRPGHTFRAVDALLTNFHLPRSSLLVLVAAFAGMDQVRRAYRVAIEREYRFYSYGDAMLIL